MTASSFRSRERGFSLVELLVVVAIMGVLASIGLPLAELAHKRQKEEQLRGALREIRSALDAYKRAGDEGRIARRADDSGYPPSLDILVQGVDDMRSSPTRKIRFLRRVPADPFASSGQTAAETWALRSYDSPPERPAAGADVYDVHSRSEAVGLNGIAYRQW